MKNLAVAGVYLGKFTLTAVPFPYVPLCHTHEASEDLSYVHTQMCPKIESEFAQTDRPAGAHYSKHTMTKRTCCRWQHRWDISMPDVAAAEVPELVELE